MSVGNGPLSHPNKVRLMRLISLGLLHRLEIDIRHRLSLSGAKHSVSIVKRSVLACILVALGQIIVHKGVIHSSVSVHCYQLV